MSRIPIGSQEALAGIRNPHRSGGKRIISAQLLEGRGLGSSSTIPPVTPSGWKSGASGCGREQGLQNLKIRSFLALFDDQHPGQGVEEGEMSSSQSKATLDSALGQDEFRRKKYLC
jgi:hypothetical protein